MAGQVLTGKATMTPLPPSLLRAIWPPCCLVRLTFARISGSSAPTTTRMARVQPIIAQYAALSC